MGLPLDHCGPDLIRPADIPQMIGPGGSQVGGGEMKSVEPQFHRFVHEPENVPGRFPCHIVLVNQEAH